MRAAFATWMGRIAPLFDTARQVHIVEVLPDSQPMSRCMEWDNHSPVQRVLCLADWRVDTLVCGAISRPLAAIAAAHGIRVISYVSGELDAVTRAWFDGQLCAGEFDMPGRRGRRPAMDQK